MEQIPIKTITQIQKMKENVRTFDIVEEGGAYYPRRSLKMMFCPYNGELLCSSKCACFTMETGEYNDHIQVALQCFAGVRTATVACISISKETSEKALK